MKRVLFSFLISTTLLCGLHAKTKKLKINVPTPTEEIIQQSNEPVESDANLEAIIDFNDKLNSQTPGSFAADSLRNMVQDTTPLKNHQAPKESRTTVFQESFVRYLKNVYNKRNYAQVLSQDGSHIVQFVELSNELNLPIETVYIGLRLFRLKLQSCELVDDTIILQLLETMPELLERHFTVNQEPSCDLTFIKKNLESMLLTRFTTSLPQFQTSPDTFLASLSTEITHYFEKEVRQLEEEKKATETRERLRAVIIKLFETALSKAIWQPSSTGIWQSFVTIANGFQRLAEHGIIDHSDDLDDLFWALTHRFCFFLDLTGASLPLSFYDEVEQNLANKTVFFLEYKEQDDDITTKKELITEALLLAKAKAFAYEKKGIMPFQM